LACAFVRMAIVARSERHDVSVVQCTHRNDRCFYTHQAGVMAVSENRWRLAQQAESMLWRQVGVNSKGDRVAEHNRDFHEYREVAPDGANLGTLMEIGAGPWTQSLWMLRQRNFTLDQYIILDPSALLYASEVLTTVFRNGKMKVGGRTYRPVIIQAPAEEMDFIQGTIDVVMMVNVLEHVLNAPRILRNVYNMLKPGGMLIFNDRWWDKEGPRDDMDLDTLFHPIRIKKRLIEQFLVGFNRIYEIRDNASYAFTIRNRNYQGTYFIGRKAARCSFNIAAGERAAAF